MWVKVPGAEVFFKDRASELMLSWCKCRPLRLLLLPQSWGERFRDGVSSDAVLCRVTGAFFILQGKMSQNFRASYTETLGKLETQYCKLMVSGLRVGL